MTELTILMPCLNEVASVEGCVREATAYLQNSGVSGQVLVCDNGSTDGSRELAASAGAEVVLVPERGYGNAIRGGLAAARGTYVIMGDCDGSYDFSQLDEMLEKLRQGWHLVMGNRYQGGIRPGAMPPLHRYLGVPLLSLLGRMRFHTPVADFHCGLRGFQREAALKLSFRCDGMEFATEMIGRFSEAGLGICQVGVSLRQDSRGHPGHLRTFRDGMRHLLLILFWKKTPSDQNSKRAC